MTTPTRPAHDTRTLPWWTRNRLRHSYIQHCGIYKSFEYAQQMVLACTGHTLVKASGENGKIQLNMQL